MGRSVLRSLLRFGVVAEHADRDAPGGATGNWLAMAGYSWTLSHPEEPAAGRHAGMIACLRWRVRSWVTVRCPLLGPRAACRGVLPAVEFFAVFFGAGMVGVLEPAAVANESLV